MSDKEHAEVPLSDPMRRAWEAYKTTDEYVNTKRWASDPNHVDGSLWAAFCEGWREATQSREGDGQN